MDLSVFHEGDPVDGAPFIPLEQDRHQFGERRLAFALHDEVELRVVPEGVLDVEGHVRPAHHGDQGRLDPLGVADDAGGLGKFMVTEVVPTASAPKSSMTLRSFSGVYLLTM